MKLLLLIAVMLALFIPASAQADWRWETPKFKMKKIKPACSARACRVLARKQAKAVRRARIKYFNARRRAEWRTWTRLYIPRCTWYGESGTGPKYAKYRYTMPNSSGSGAFGKFQFMPGTYFSVGKYKDWSPLDQEIAARKEYWRHGTEPWTNCG
jgi:hypothetical protein